MAVDRNARKTKVGIVVSDKMDKTIVVAMEDFIRHLSSPVAFSSA